MLRYTTDRAKPGLVALYDIRPGNGAGQFLQPRSPHGAIPNKLLQVNPVLRPVYHFFDRFYENWFNVYIINK